MKKLLNIILIILLSITIFIVTFSMTILNNSFVKLSLTIHNHYEEITNNINNELKDEYKVDINDVKSDVNNYVSSYYEDKNYTPRVVVDDSYYAEFNTIYNNHIKFYKPTVDIKFYHDIFDIIIIVIICVIGFIFVKTKKKHTLNFILIVSSIIGMITSGILYILNDYSGYINTIVSDSCNVYLGVNLFILLIIIYKRLLKRFKIICK